MEEDEFRRRLSERGYAEPEVKAYAPGTDGPMHAHEFAVSLLVLDGEFTLARPDGTTTYRPGECCDLPAGAMHTERTGTEGARVLLGKKRPPAEGAPPQ